RHVAARLSRSLSHSPGTYATYALPTRRSSDLPAHGPAEAGQTGHPAAVGHGQGGRRGLRAAEEEDPRGSEDEQDEGEPPEHQDRSEEHTSELQSRFDLVCRRLLEKTKVLKTSH